MCFRNFNGRSNPKSLQDLVIDLPPCHHRAIHPQPTTTPTPGGHETHDFLHVAINILNWVAFFFWDQTTILIYIYIGLGLLAPNAKTKKTDIFQQQKTWIAQPS